MLCNKIWFPFILLCCIAAACQPQPSTDAHNENAKAYDADGYLGLTNTNPNLHTSPTYHTYQEDLDLMRDTIEQLDGIQRATFFINGDELYVTIHPEADINTGRDTVRLQDKAKKALRYMLPRYNIHVTVDPYGR